MIVNGARNVGWTFYVDSEADIPNLPTDKKIGKNGKSENDVGPCPIGSCAIVGESGACYVLFPNSTWSEV
ncbi:MAG: hypothetical protein MJZ37_00755 [Bacilli bacterium]|nr:hypothetical protein [Bacilli bacterium]